jgi:ribosomal protein S18 acetylase RimI-like enzyme
MAWGIDGYDLKRGDRLDRAALQKFMGLTYRELFPEAQLGHLATTIEHHFAPATPLWWVETAGERVACLWLGNAIDQITGERHAHVFLLYVQPQHRRQRIGRSLMAVAEAWAKDRGDRQMTLQVFRHNQPALQLYESLGYQTQSISLVKSLS